MQILYSVSASAVFVAVLVLIREPRVLQRYTYLFGLAGLILLALPALLPASISEVPGTGAKIQVRHRRLLASSRRSSPSWRWPSPSPATWWPSETCCALAGRRMLGIDLPRARDLGPMLVVWALSLLLLVFESDIGTSAVFMGLFVAMLYIATERTSWR